MILMIPTDHYQFPCPVELVGQTDQYHCWPAAVVVAGPAGAEVEGEVLVAAAVG